MHLLMDDKCDYLINLSMQHVSVYINVIYLAAFIDYAAFFSLFRTVNCENCVGKLAAKNILIQHIVPAFQFFFY